MFVEVMKTIHLQALRFIQNNEWDAAHRLVQDYTDPLSRQIHGYLHYIEGDLDNASYWYRLIGMALPDGSPEEELKRLTKAIGETN
ncbi:hypothetical protein MGMO_38c00110 [Methyloglobulus morosus KoM1]|uniref:Tetratricopeptide repeat protein n=2 Tax=Methyloglobulus TaxID=1410680 RepID=V5C8K3_9GAMM|nr:hypothetical protein MGMO_38c00110 [Methyloglobulus morosus KoM1]